MECLKVTARFQFGLRYWFVVCLHILCYEAWCAAPGAFCNGKATAVPSWLYDQTATRSCYQVTTSMPLGVHLLRACNSNRAALGRRSGGATCRCVDATSPLRSFAKENHCPRAASKAKCEKRGGPMIQLHKQNCTPGIVATACTCCAHLGRRLGGRPQSQNVKHHLWLLPKCAYKMTMLRTQHTAVWRRGIAGGVAGVHRSAIYVSQILQGGCDL